MRAPHAISGCALVALLAATAGGGATTGDAAPPSPETIHWSSSVGEVDFPHQMHAEDLGVSCDTCHHGIVAPKLALPHPDYFTGFWLDCSTCHTGSATASDVSSGHRCATCHPERPTGGAKVEMPTVKVAIHQSCWSCHEQGRGAQASAQCGTCHQRTDPTGSAATAAAGR